MRIRDLMRADVITVDPGMNLLELDELFMNRRISGAPVYSPEKGVLGMVSKTDLVRALTEELLQTELPLEALLVEDIMTHAIVRVEADDSVVCVARLMLERHVHRVLVFDDEEVVGIATSFDMLRAIVESEDPE